MMPDACIEDVFWTEAVNTAAYLHARSPSASVEGRTPYEMLNGEGNIPPFHHLSCWLQAYPQGSKDWEILCMF